MMHFRTTSELMNLIKLVTGTAFLFVVTLPAAQSAHAQAGAEAAIITSQSAQWAKKYGSKTGSSVADVFTYSTGSITVPPGCRGVSANAWPSSAR